MAQFKFETLSEAVAKAKEMVMTHSYVTIIQSLLNPYGTPDNKKVYFVEDEEESGFLRYWESEPFLFDGYGHIGATLKRRRTMAIKRLDILLSGA